MRVLHTHEKAALPEDTATKQTFSAGGDKGHLATRNLSNALFEANGRGVGCRKGKRIRVWDIARSALIPQYVR
jgi:hypothetical protein